MVCHEQIGIEQSNQISCLLKSIHLHEDELVFEEIINFLGHF